MEKDRKKRLFPALIQVKQAMPLLLLAVGIAFVCLVGGLMAKYVTSASKGDNRIGANDFYFSVDLMEAVEGEDENRVLERTVELYGAGQNSLTFTVQNFFDGLRISTGEIAYTLSWEGAVTLELEDASVTSGSAHTLAGGSQNGDTFTASFTDTTQAATAVITVASTAPYTKEMKLTVKFSPEIYDVLYRVEDSVGSVYANLIVMVGKEDGVDAGKLRFLWDESLLQIDCTNTHIVEQNGDTLTVPAGVSIGNTVSTQPVGEMGSISVFFFKTDPAKDHSQADTVVEADGNGIYPINIGPAAAD